MARTYAETLAAIDADSSIDKDRKTALKSQAQDREYGEDPFDLEKYRSAAGIAYDFSKQKMEGAGAQERETIGKGATEQRTSTEQSQEFKEKDEARDYGQAQRAYRY